MSNAPLEAVEAAARAKAKWMPVTALEYHAAGACDGCDDEPAYVLVTRYPNGWHIHEIACDECVPAHVKYEIEDARIVVGRALPDGRNVYVEQLGNAEGWAVEIGYPGCEHLRTFRRRDLLDWFLEGLMVGHIDDNDVDVAKDARDSLMDELAEASKAAGGRTIADYRELAMSNL